MVKKYKKRPVVVEVLKTEWGMNVREIRDFVGDDLIILGNGRTLQIKTLEGNMEVTPGDYIIKGIKGEFYPCKPEIFKESYDLVEGK